MTITEDATLGEAQSWLRDRVDDGERCPCCTQFAKVYRRKINSGMARALIALWRKAGTDFVHLNSTVSAISHYTRAYFGTVQRFCNQATPSAVTRQKLDLPPSSRSTSGSCSINPHHDNCAASYDGRLMALVGDDVSVVDALGARFNYDELMAGL